jgi:3-isopropylmalate dehydrogenase
VKKAARVISFPGDGVGPEVVAEAIKVLRAVEERFSVALEVHEAAIGGSAIDRYGESLRAEEIESCRQADAAVLGAVGGPKWDVPGAPRPEQGLLKIRKALGLFANIRPVTVFPMLADASPLKPDIVKGVDIVVVRELTGGIYFGRPSRQWHERRGRAAVDTLVYREHEIRRVARLAFELARTREGRLASVDKANVLTSSRLWRQIVTEEAANYPDVTLEHVLVDAMAMHLVRQPARYDVIVTENMFGDILTDEASVLSGSIGLLPSASLGATQDGASDLRFGLYEPIHGSAPDIAGQGKANPIGTILSAAMMLRLSLGIHDAADAVERAVSATIADGVRTPDIDGTATTTEVGDAVVAQLATS